MTETQPSATTPLDGPVVEREDIKDDTPEVWDNEMRYVRLENGLRLVLSCNKMTGLCSGTMIVGCGSSMDPPGIPGLAHFCEHMLFLGTGKFPAENVLSQCVEAHCGSTSAKTDVEITFFSFQTDCETYQEALGRFAQFFIDPLSQRVQWSVKSTLLTASTRKTASLSAVVFLQS